MYICQYIVVRVNEAGDDSNDDDDDDDAAITLNVVYHCNSFKCSKT